MPIITQRDATIYSLFISVNCCTYFGWYLHLSSGAYGTVSTASGIAKTVTATFREHDWTGTEFSSSHVLMVLLMSDAADTVTWAPTDGWRYHPKYVEQFTDISKLCIVASLWIIIGIYSRCTDPRTSDGPKGGFNPPTPRNSEVSAKLSRIPSSVENTSVTV
jgi:hypothetical protein